MTLNFKAMQTNDHTEISPKFLNQVNWWEVIWNVETNKFFLCINTHKKNEFHMSLVKNINATTYVQIKRGFSTFKLSTYMYLLNWKLQYTDLIYVI